MGRTEDGTSAAAAAQIMPPSRLVAWPWAAGIGRTVGPRSVGSWFKFRFKRSKKAPATPAGPGVVSSLSVYVEARASPTDPVRMYLCPGASVRSVCSMTDDERSSPKNRTERVRGLQLHTLSSPIKALRCSTQPSELSPPNPRSLRKFDKLLMDLGGFMGPVGLVIRYRMRVSWERPLTATVVCD